MNTSTVTPMRMIMLSGRSGDMKSCYYRNNRSDRKKNLRCFPYCSEVHSDSKFCGSYISTSLLIPADSRVKIEDLVFLGEFVCVSPSAPPVCRIPLSDIISPERYAGKVMLNKKSRHQDGAYTVNFNDGLTAWCYSWSSNKQRTMYEHVFRAVAYTEVGAELVPVASCDSPCFRVFSSRRRLPLPDEAKLLPVGGPACCSEVKEAADRLIKYSLQEEAFNESLLELSSCREIEASPKKVFDVSRIGPESYKELYGRIICDFDMMFPAKDLDHSEGSVLDNEGSLLDNEEGSDSDCK